MSLLRLSAVLAALTVLAACSDGPVKRVHPSTASIQQLAVLPDGSWKILLRIQNYSTFAMHYSVFDAHLSINEVDAGELKLAPDLDIVGSNGDVIETTLRPATRLPASGDFAYRLKGTIETSEPKESFTFDRASRLSPVPGIANTYR